MHSALGVAGLRGVAFAASGLTARARPFEFTGSSWRRTFVVPAFGLVIGLVEVRGAIHRALPFKYISRCRKLRGLGPKELLGHIPRLAADHRDVALVIDTGEVNPGPELTGPDLLERVPLVAAHNDE